MAASAPPALCLRYLSPAGHFNEALPVGNGQLGAMVFGQTHRERLVLNEDSCWAGGPRDRFNPARGGALAELRALLFAGRHAEANALASARFLAVPRFIDSYQPMGELDLRVGWRAVPSHYRRWLDLDGAVAVCEWREGNAQHRRTVFASAPDQVLVIHHEVISGLVSLSARLTREGPAVESMSTGGDLLLQGCAHAEAARHGDQVDGPLAGHGIPVALRLRGIVESGHPTIQGDRFQVCGAGRVTLLVAMATKAREPDPAAACREVLDAAATRPYAELLARHQADHQTLFRRFHICLGAPADDGRPLDERLAALRGGASDPGLLALAAQHRRYLLIATSRPGTLPSNLQGIWTEQQQGPWNSDYHFNINLQMNYWLAEPTGLGECVDPVIAWTENVASLRGERTARELYGCRGWTLHHLSDAWGATEPFDGLWGLWPWGGAWLALHLHERWRYSGDPAVLARVWPLLRGAVRFVLDFLTEGPAGTAHAGLLTTCPSHSPENAFLTAEGEPVKFTYGVTMDFGLCRALFAAGLEEIDAGGGDHDRELRAEIVAAGTRLPPLAISARTGGIREWAEDHAEADPGHRHISPLFDLHPGVGISLLRTPNLAAAAATTLRHKATHQADNTDGQPGWTLNWIACFWARLGQGDEAHARLVRLLTHASTPNLLTVAHGQPQVADACGTTAAICEMLVQDHEGVVHLLPALPSAWPTGEVAGLRLRGGVTLDLVWRAGAVSSARFVADRPVSVQLAVPANCTFYVPVPVHAGVAVLTLSAGAEVSLLAAAKPAPIH